MIRRVNPVCSLEEGCACRRGSILVWFAVLLFALLPLMTVIVHLGLVTLTRRQMQTAVNAAAIEGLRFRDNTDLAEVERREQVRDRISAVYDDSFDTGDGDLQRSGAGPTLIFDDEPGDIPLPGTEFKAARTIRGSIIGVYDPLVELNESDESHGDMVRGNYYSGVGHAEANNYLRDDFTPDAGGNAFLVRLRRTDNASGLDDVAGVSSSGPAIPFLFGRIPAGDSQFLDRRERGTVVRATAIAQARPVLTAGWYHPDYPTVGGLGPIVVTYSEWTAAVQPVPVTSSHFVDATSGPLSIGALRPGPPAGMPADFTSERRYVAIIDDVTDRVIGFGGGILDFDSMAGAGTVTREPSAIASVNVSAQLLAPPGGLSEAVWEYVFDAHRAFDVHAPGFDPDSQPLLAPALVRTIE